MICVYVLFHNFIIGNSYYHWNLLYSKYVTINNDNIYPSNLKILNGKGICIPAIIPPELINSYCISNSHIFNNLFLDMSNN